MKRRRKRRVLAGVWTAARNHSRAIAVSAAVLAGTGSVAAVAAWALPRVWSNVAAHPYFALAEVTVRGNARVSRSEVLQWAGLHEGMSVWSAAPEVVQARLLAHPSLVSVQVRRDFPRRLLVQVRERVPVAIAALDDALYYVDRSGAIMEDLDVDDTRDLPVITGVRWADFASGGATLLRRAVRLVRLCQREGCGAGVAEIHMDRERGATLIPMRRPIAVFLAWGNWRTKLARTTRVLEIWEGREAQVAVIDASFRNQVVVRLREVPKPSPAARKRSGVRA